MIRMLLVGYCLGIRSEPRLCEEVHLNLAYRWFCRLDLADRVPDHSTFSKNRHGRFRESDLLREVFEARVRACIAAGMVGGERFAVDESLIEADANNRTSQARRNAVRRPRLIAGRQYGKLGAAFFNEIRGRRSFASATPRVVDAGPDCNLLDFEPTFVSASPTSLNITRTIEIAHPGLTVAGASTPGRDVLLH